MTKKSENPQGDTDELIAQLSSDDCAAAESAFEALRRRIGEVKSRIYYAANREQDANSLSYLIELLGESRDPKYLPFIAGQLRSEHVRVRFFAHAALFGLGTPEARDLHHRCNLRRLLFGERRGGAKRPDTRGNLSPKRH